MTKPRHVSKGHIPPPILADGDLLNPRGLAKFRGRLAYHETKIAQERDPRRQQWLALQAWIEAKHMTHHVLHRLQWFYGMAATSPSRSASPGTGSRPTSASTCIALSVDTVTGTSTGSSRKPRRRGAGTAG